MPNISNVGVDRVNDGDYALNWQTSEARYHVWLAPENHEPRAAIGQRGKQIYKRDLTEDVKSQCRFLSLSIAKNKAMFDDAMAQAVAGNLFKQCDEKIAQHEKERLAKAHAEYLIKLQHDAGPEMYQALCGLLHYLRDLWPDEPLFSNDADKQAEAIRNAEKALLLAETGGKVEL